MALIDLKKSIVSYYVKIRLICKSVKIKKNSSFKMKKIYKFFFFIFSWFLKISFEIKCSFFSPWETTYRFLSKYLKKFRQKLRSYWKLCNVESKVTLNKILNLNIYLFTIFCVGLWQYRFLNIFVQMYLCYILLCYILLWVTFKVVIWFWSLKRYCIWCCMALICWTI